MSRFYVEDSEGRVVGKFDGMDINPKDGHQRHEVESIQELSEVPVDEWDADYTQL